MPSIGKILIPVMPVAANATFVSSLGKLESVTSSPGTSVKAEEFRMRRWKTRGQNLSASPPQPVLRSLQEARIDG